MSLRIFTACMLLLGTLVGCQESDPSSTTERQSAPPPGDPALLELSQMESIGEAANGDPAEAPAGKDAAETPMPAETVLTEPDADTVPTKPLAEPGESLSLAVGNAAPPISIAKWVKGEPVQSFAPDTVHVVEFWATWCGPCLASMPHIAGLQTEYGDKVTFIGVSDEDDATVSDFMTQMARGKDVTWSELLTYRIALDDNGKTNAAWMQAAGQNGIPCAFIVGKSGKVEWIGHPMEIDSPLQQVVEGTWDLEKAVALAAESEKKEKARDEFGPKIGAALQSGDFETAVGLIDQLIEQFPNDKDFLLVRLQFLIQGGLAEKANQTAKTLLEGANDNPQELNQLAWMLATGTDEPGIDLELAHSAAQRAVELTEEKDASIIDTLARVVFRKGQIEEAITLQKQALELAPEEPSIQAALEEYEQALKDKEAPGEPEKSEPEKSEPEKSEPEKSEPEKESAPDAESEKSSEEKSSEDKAGDE